MTGGTESLTERAFYDRQEQMREAWMAGIPKKLRRRPDKAERPILAPSKFEVGGLAFSERAFGLIPEIARLFSEGLGYEDIVVRTGLAKSTVKKAIAALVKEGACTPRGAGFRSGKPCVIDGVEYPSQVAAARALGLNENAICRRLKKEALKRGQA